MSHHQQFYIDGRWVSPKASTSLHPVVNPATEKTIATVALGSAADVDVAVEAATRAFASWSKTSRAERMRVLEKVAAIYEQRMAELAEVVTSEMGAPSSLSANAHVPFGLGHLKTTIGVLAGYQLESRSYTTTNLREPIGVCGLITPWNLP